MSSMTTSYRIYVKRMGSRGDGTSAPIKKTIKEAIQAYLGWKKRDMDEIQTLSLGVRHERGGEWLVPSEQEFAAFKEQCETLDIPEMYGLKWNYAISYYYSLCEDGSKICRQY